MTAVLQRERVQAVLRSARWLSVGTARSMSARLFEEDPSRSKKRLRYILNGFEQPKDPYYLLRALAGKEPYRSYLVRYVGHLNLGPMEPIVMGMVEEVAPGFNWEI